MNEDDGAYSRYRTYRTYRRYRRYRRISRWVEGKAINETNFNLRNDLNKLDYHNAFVVCVWFMLMLNQHILFLVHITLPRTHENIGWWMKYRQRLLALFPGTGSPSSSSFQLIWHLRSNEWILFSISLTQSATIANRISTAHLKSHICSREVHCYPKLIWLNWWTHVLDYHDFPILLESRTPIFLHEQSTNHLTLITIYPSTLSIIEYDFIISLSRLHASVRS